MAKIKKNSHKILYRKYSANIKYIMMALTVFIITFFLPKQPRFRYEFQKGKIWLNKDLISPFSFAILKTNPQVSTDKKDALENVLPIYRYDSELLQDVDEAYANEFDVKWNGNAFPEDERVANKTASLKLLNEIYQKGIIATNAKHQKGRKYYDVSLLNNNVTKTISTQDLYTVQTALDYFNKTFTTTNLKVKEMVMNLVEDHLQPNIIFDEKLTGIVQDNTINSLSTTRGMVQKGELIIARNNVIDDEVYQKLQSFKETYEAQTKTIGDSKIVYLGQILLVSFILSLLMIFLYLFRKDIYADNRQLSLLMLVITSMLLSLTYSIKLNLPSLYYIPFCIVPIIIRILFDTRLALYLHLLVILIAGFFVPNSFEFVFYQTTAGMVAIYSIRNLIKREQLLLSALYILTAYFICFLGIGLLREGSFKEIEWMNFVPFIFSVLLSLLAYPLIYAFERVFGITSDVALIELTNTNNKLLRELAFKAPGTFQHSLQVANLAEAAIFKIGGNSLLVRAGALYHDIGKIENPQYFIENQNTTLSPHDKLPYEQSAQIIIKHVHKGIEITRRHQLPESVIDFIRTHHGNTRVDYFYQSFLKNSPEKFVDENTFRYPGPIPFSKETGVLMLADSVEAASRSIKNPDAQNINDLVERIINYKLEQNQLDNCDLTLKDLETIKLIFKTMLMSIYHVRIDYLQNV
ncbi:transmembrane HD family protein [Pedobacter antarcticus 4BY]|uniref:Transmembrane HD family protein n=2 Tax=Pedobacter antarcticus TaxID=34086 RepID=A0A081PKE7_9SPHI|nr:HDIG domain-containing metalloprotein [Pedobacter antarcticus]KEQ31170.1 transmembrane HD family protein [Pedobacter antarcticus 4BY]